MARPVLHIKDYSETGTKSAKKVRSEGLIPSTLSSKGETSNILVQEKEIQSLINEGLTESVLIDIKADSKEDETAFIRKIHRHPLSRQIQNIEFYRITFGEKIHTQAEIKVLGSAVGVKMGGILEVLLDNVKIECLPKDIPDNIEIDVSNLDIGDSIHVSDLAIPENVKLFVDEAILVAICHAPKVKEEEETAVETEEVAEETEEDKKE